MSENPNRSKLIPIVGTVLIVLGGVALILTALVSLFFMPVHVYSAPQPPEADEFTEAFTSDFDDEFMSDFEADMRDFEADMREFEAEMAVFEATDFETQTTYLQRFSRISIGLSLIGLGAFFLLRRSKPTADPTPAA